MKKREPLSAPGYTLDQNGDVHIDHGATARALRLRLTPQLYALLSTNAMMLIGLFMPHIAITLESFDSAGPL
jgi:hypothetical protein